jgi:preprotein translocase subunit SecY
VAGRADHPRGVGNGISLIIFAGIVANLPHALVGRWRWGGPAHLDVFIISLLFIVVCGVAFIIFIERPSAAIVVQIRSASRQRMSGGESSHLPLKINTSGVIPRYSPVPSF